MVLKPMQYIAIPVPCVCCHQGVRLGMRTRLSFYVSGRNACQIGQACVAKAPTAMSTQVILRMTVILGLGVMPAAVQLSDTKERAV